MVQQLDLKQLFKELLTSDEAHVYLGHSEVSFRLHDNHRMMILSTMVYFGGNYIPTRVREALVEKPPFNLKGMKPNLRVNEEKFEIDLEIDQTLSEVYNPDIFVSIVEDFCWLADQWREFFDEHDKNDRVYVKVPRP